jgi:DNA primase catalytic subunit
MDTLFIPTERDFKNWIREAVQESLDVSAAQMDKANEQTREALLSRKEIGKYLVFYIIVVPCPSSCTSYSKLMGNIFLFTRLH